MNTYLIFGFGFSAQAFAKRRLALGERVIGTYRTEKPDFEGVEFISFDGETPLDDFSLRFKNVTHILISIPPDKDQGDRVFALHGEDFKKLPEFEWLGYLSTTGVYGNRDGAEVDETSELHPTSRRAQARVEAETQWLESGLPVHIFRLAGIYGPGRNLFHQILSDSARHIDKPGHRFSRIHRDDIAGVLEASLEHPNPGSVYNVCDDLPCEPGTVLTYACALLGVDPPAKQPFDEAAKTMSPMALSFWRDNKTVANDKIKTELGYDLIYPTYQDGLKALLEEVR